MPKWLKYYSYRLPESFKVVLVGTEKSQIISTIEHYRQRGQNIVLPDESRISETPSLEIRCANPLLSPKFFFKAEVRENIVFDVNANFYYDILEVADNYKILKRGDLYKFQAGITEFGLYFLPEYIMEGVKEYDWNQHKEIVDKWDKVLDDISNDRIILSRDNIRVKDPKKLN